MRFAYEWHDDSGNWFRSYGNENWEFDEQGLMRRRFASINDLPIAEAERKFHWPLGRRPDDHPSLSELVFETMEAPAMTQPDDIRCRAAASACAACRLRRRRDRRWLTPSQAFAEALGIVELIKSEAAKTPIAIHQLRGNVAMLEGSGGNVAVLTGRDGKVLIDAGIAVSRPQVATALAAMAPSQSRI